MHNVSDYGKFSNYGQNNNQRKHRLPLYGRERYAIDMNVIEYQVWHKNNSLGSFYFSRFPDIFVYEVERSTTFNASSRTVSSNVCVKERICMYTSRDYLLKKLNQI